MIYPDLGLRFLNEGASREVAHNYFGVPFTEVDVCGPGLYTVTLNRDHDSERYAMSLDFDDSVLFSLMKALPEHEANAFMGSIRICSGPSSLQLPRPITVNQLVAYLGELQHGRDDSFVPFVIAKVVCTPHESRTRASRPITSAPVSLPTAHQIGAPQTEHLNASATAMQGLTALIAAFSISLMLMNLFGGIVSGVWLACLGEWKILGIGLLVGSFAAFPISIALMPAILFALPSAKLIERGKIRLGIVLSAPATLYTVAVMAAWCYLVFSVAFGLAAERHPIPILLWSYGVATGPWAYMASKEDRGSEAGASTMYVFFISLAYLLMVAMRLIGDAEFWTCFTALIVVMLLALVFQFIMTVAALRAVRQTLHE